MHVVTFYSFKGGVGRTMSLVNVASQLAIQGRKVLIVDFDIEAPGITTFDFCEAANNTPGVVNFVSEFLDTHEAPPVEKFIAKCSLPMGEEEYPIWVMPAGHRGDDYGIQLNHINWDDLYLHHSGYLLFEDLKAQWKEHLNPDYVFIDSRTGHTDVSGICTRQLPDAVVALFFPNKQNLLGLKEIVNQIHDHNREDADKRIDLHFVSSNTPDLDDEYGILKTNLNEFSEELGYQKLSTIHHYNSMALLDQDIFALSRPTTRLAEEYRQLTTEIIQNNPADREGAIAFLRKLESDTGRGRHFEKATLLENMLRSIQDEHPKNGQILGLLGEVRLSLGAIDDAIELLTEAINNGVESIEVFKALASVYRQKGDKENAVKALLRLLDQPADYFDTSLAIRWISELHADELKTAVHSVAINKLDGYERFQIAENLQTKRETLPYSLEIAESTLSANLEEAPSLALRSLKTLVLIGLQRFEEAYEFLGPKSEVLQDESISRVYNLAMAAWGMNKEPDLQLVDRVLALNKEKIGTGGQNEDPNYAMCMAIAYGLSNQRELAKEWCAHARLRAERSAGNQISPWRYLSVGTKEFLVDTDAVDKFIDNNSIMPQFIS